MRQESDFINHLREIGFTVVSGLPDPEKDTIISLYADMIPNIVEHYRLHDKFLLLYDHSFGGSYRRLLYYEITKGFLTQPAVSYITDEDPIRVIKNKILFGYVQELGKILFLELKKEIKKRKIK